MTLFKRPGLENLSINLEYRSVDELFGLYFFRLLGQVYPIKKEYGVQVGLVKYATSIIKVSDLSTDIAELKVSAQLVLGKREQSAFRKN